MIGDVDLVDVATWRGVDLRRAIMSIHPKIALEELHTKEYVYLEFINLYTTQFQMEGV